MNNLFVDVCVLLTGTSIFGLEYLAAHYHTPFGIAIDIALVVFFIYRAVRKELSYAGLLLLFFPVFHGLSLASQTYLNNIFPSQFFLLVTAVLLGYGYYQIYSKGGPKRVINDRVAPKQDIKKPGQYSVFINQDIIIPEQSRYTHLQVIGGTGSGKTRYIFYPHILQDIMNGAGVLIFDIKSNMRKRIEQFVIAAKREKDFFCFNLGDPNSDSYNPEAGDDPGEIFNRTFTAQYYDMNNSEQFYIDVAKRFLPAAIAVLKKKYTTITFEDLYWITVSPKKYLQPICNEMPDDINAKYLIDFMKKEDLDKLLMGLVNKLAQFVTPAWTSQINTTNPKIDIGKIVSEGKILLFQANSGVYQQEYKAISILLMMHVQSEIARRYAIPQDQLKPFFIYLDEFDKIVYPGFAELINKAREAKVGLIFGHQSIGDLKQYGEALQNQILTNARNKVVLKLKEPTTAEYFSKAFGTRTVERRVTSYGSDGSVSGYSDKLEEEFNIHPNDIKFLKLGQACVDIEDDEGGKPYINIIRLEDIKQKFLEGAIERPAQENIDGKRTNLDLNTVKGDNITGKSGGLKWKHIKANNENLKNQDANTKEENNDEEDEDNNEGLPVKA